MYTQHNTFIHNSCIQSLLYRIHDQGLLQFLPRATFPSHAFRVLLQISGQALNALLCGHNRRLAVQECKVEEAL